MTRYARMIFAALFLTGAGIVTSGTASAGEVESAKLPLPACAYPYVCLYTSSQAKVGQFQDVTSGYQNFSRTDIWYAKNTRNDDVAYFRYNDGSIGCIGPNSEVNLRGGSFAGKIPTGIRIDSSSVCFP